MSEPPRSVFRCDRLPLPMNRSKEAAVRGMLRDWRGAATTASAMAWRGFWRGGRFEPRQDHAKDQRKACAAARQELLDAIVSRPDLMAHRLAGQRKAKTGAEDRPKRRLPTPPGLIDPMAQHKEQLGAAPVQMVVAQVAGVLESFLANRMNEFVSAVVGSSLFGKGAPSGSPAHMLFAVNKAQAWFDLGREVKVPTGDGGSRAVPQELRLLARKIMSAVLKRHGRPSMRRIGMLVDARVAALQAPSNSGHFDLWLRLAMPRRPVLYIPVQTYRRYEARDGIRCQTLQIGPDRYGRLTVGAITDIGEAAAAERQRYAAIVERDHVALDWGLVNLLATDRGDLFGRNFIDKLCALDATIQGIARHVQRSGKRPRESRRYREHVARLRGFVRTEVNRVFNRIVAVLKPSHLVLERLDFSDSSLSKRMNRILSNCGRAAVKAKLRAMEEEKGISSETVQPAYTSRTCPSCDYVDPRNRRRTRFRCLWCGHERNADVVGARNIGARRSRSGRKAAVSGRLSKEKTLALLVRRHGERHAGRGGPSADPRTTNPYFKGERKAVARSSGALRAAKLGKPPKGSGVESVPHLNPNSRDNGALEDSSRHQFDDPASAFPAPPVYGCTRISRRVPLHFGHQSFGRRSGAR